MSDLFIDNWAKAKLNSVLEQNVNKNHGILILSEEHGKNLYMLEMYNIDDVRVDILGPFSWRECSRKESHLRRKFTANRIPIYSNREQWQTARENRSG